MQELIRKLEGIAGAKACVTGEQELEPHLTEWRGTWRGRAAVMVAPSTTDQVAEVVRACGDAGVSIVPQGGNTGLCGGAIPDQSGKQVLLSLSRMNRIRSVDADDYSLIAEAGCVLADVQAAAGEAGRLFPLSLAAEGSCQIGGNLSTNAGGTNVLRYGTARDQVLGLEVVLASGEILHGLRTLRKDTAGYDVKQLFIGSEGTLGIITAAALRLYPKPANRQVALLGLESAGQAVSLFADLRERMSDQLQAFELISARALDLVRRHIPDSRVPLDEYPWYVLLDSTSASADNTVEAQLMAAIETGLALDAVLAKNENEEDALWRLRHSISEAQKREGASLKHDISVPVGSVARFIETAEPAVEASVPGSRVVVFGHVGDGNVHFNVSQPRSMAPEEFLASRERVAGVVYDIVLEFGGSISAEHGVGVLKKDQLGRYRDPAEVGLMKTLKRALDPQNLLNPGKVVEVSRGS